MEDFKSVNAEYLLNQPLKEVTYIVQDLIPIGLSIFCGASKVGKSWLMLDLCLKVSKGEDFWGYKTNQGDVLYLCLEDTFARIQNRLFKLTDTANDKLHFVNEANKISNGFLKQLEDFIIKVPTTKLIVIDTLQKIRNTSVDFSYANDYGDISILKKIADKYKLAIIVVHHIRKQGDSDVFNKVSGTNGIMGSADATFILQKESRSSSTAKLYVTGRDIEYQEITLRFNDCKWELISIEKQEEIETKNTPEVIYKVIAFMSDKETWQGSATELLNVLNEKDVAPTLISKILNEYHSTTLKENNITYSLYRDKNGRKIILTKTDEKRIGDNGDNDDNGNNFQLHF